MRTAFIYGLRCPITGEIRYVGKCDDPKARLPGHLKDSSKNHRTNWLVSLKTQGLIPILEVIAKVPESEWEFWERSYIRLYRCLGFDLVNGTDGGEGVTMTPEIRAKIGAANRGKTHTLEQCAKWSSERAGSGNVMWGKIHTPEARDKQRAARLGKKHSPETIAKIRAYSGEKSPNFGKKKSPEHRAKLRVARLRYWEAKKNGNK